MNLHSRISKSLNEDYSLKNLLKGWWNWFTRVVQGWWNWFTRVVQGWQNWFTRVVQGWQNWFTRVFQGWQNWFTRVVQGWLQARPHYYQMSVCIHTVIYISKYNRQVWLRNSSLTNIMFKNFVYFIQAHPYNYIYTLNTQTIPSANVNNTSEFHILYLNGFILSVYLSERFPIYPHDDASIIHQSRMSSILVNTE